MTSRLVPLVLVFALLTPAWAGAGTPVGHSAE